MNDATTSVPTPTWNYGNSATSGVGTDHTAHAAGPNPVAHAGTTTRTVAAASPLPSGRVVEGRATTPVASGAVGRTSTGVTTGAAARG